MRSAHPYDRRALVRRTNTTEGEVARYLPDNYEVIRQINADTVEIAGHDHAGWTFEDYVRPRLWSGSFGVEEIGPMTSTIL